MWPLPRKRLHNLHETYQLPSLQLITPDDGHRRCLKHVEFRDKINFGYLMHLVGYLYEAYHDARSLEHKVGKSFFSFQKVFLSFATEMLNTPKRMRTVIQVAARSKT
jgi:hypothetical protein